LAKGGETIAALSGGSDSLNPAFTRAFRRGPANTDQHR